MYFLLQIIMTKSYKLNTTIVYTKITKPFIILKKGHNKAIALFSSQLLNKLLKSLNN